MGVKNIYKLAFSNNNNNNQIEGEKQLPNLSGSIKFMSNKFNEFEKGRQKQKKVIEELRSEIFSLNEKLDCITEQVDRQEQYSRRNCLLMHGITKKIQKNTDDLALEIFKEK